MTSKLPADLIIDNVSVITMNPNYPSAHGVAIANGKFIGLLNKNETWPLTSNGKHIDGNGMTLFPGLIDAHFHLKGQISNNFAISCDRNAIKSIKNIIHLLKKHAHSLPKDKWIRAMNYDPFHLQEERHPTRLDLDKATTLHPIRLRHVTRHASVLNSVALKIAGINRYSVDPPGVTVDRIPETNEPTGLIFGGDAWLSNEVIPPLTSSELKQGAKKLQNDLLSQGIVAIQDATPTNNIFDLQFWHSQIDKSWPITIQFMTGIDHYDQMAAFAKDLPNHVTRLLEMGPIKIVMESSPEIHPNLKEMIQIATYASNTDISLAIHVVEPEMISIALEAIRHSNSNKHLSHRFEHLSLCPDAFLHDISELGISVVTNPSLVHDHGDRYLNDVDSSIHDWLYRMGSLVSNEILLAAGSDAPVATLNPWISIHTACTRSTASGNTLGLNEKLNRWQALEMYTTNAAKIAGWESDRGMIAPGLNADFIWLDQNPLTCQHLPTIEVNETWINGELVYRL